ncbi:hypothetical protein L3X38_036867 [Prunus dulcis]|uniref:Uncharacterized protein n=1 Tax=Prunus dulcis TaxID=3755 RepID=A0AAD4V214_PRUDU|nr:hypothetical protein L3X38_036867 [Prunus dulcis]
MEMYVIERDEIDHGVELDPREGQKCQAYYAEWYAVKKEEVDKLTKIGFIREVNYPNLLANVVMVRKTLVKWQVDLVLHKVILATRKPADGSLGLTWELPYRVIDIVCPSAYRLRDLKGANLPHPWNAGHLKKYYQ